MALDFTLKKTSKWPSSDLLFNKILKNEIDEEFRELQKIMSTSLHEILVGLTEAELMQKPREIVSAVVEERLKGRISKELARDILDTVYQENNSMKQEIWDKVEAKINLDQNLLRKKWID